MAALFTLVWQRCGPTLLLGLYSTYSTILVLVLIVDRKHRLIPQVIIYPAWGLGLLGSLLHPAASFPRVALMGGMMGFGLMLAACWLGRLSVKVACRSSGVQQEGDRPWASAK
jgi:prepilin signal peptidase PulO-like enzyme (type II secretory pathway)